jgi:GH18 family chitinase
MLFKKPSGNWYLAIMHAFAKRMYQLFVKVVVVASPFVTACKGTELVGYLPYYRMGATYNTNVLPAQLTMLNEVRYFGLTAGSDGSIQPLQGTLQTNLNNIATIKQLIDSLPPGQRPRLDITLGGAGQAASFSTIAASTTLRSTFAQSINSLLNQTGATAVDIDWEHPDPNRNNANEYLVNYPAMLQRIKQEVGASRRIYATVDPIKMIPPSVFNGPNGIDGISLMTYDLGWWANDDTDFNRGEHSLQEYAVDAVKSWTDPSGSPVPANRNYVFGVWGNNTSPGELGVGLPFYGKVIGTSQAPSSGTAYTYADLVAGGTPDTSGNYYTYFGQNVWTAGPGVAAQRVQFAHDRGLQNIIIWEIGQDLDSTNPNSLLRTAFLKNETLGGDFNGDHNVDTADYNIWRANVGSTTDLRADANGNGTIDAGDYVVWRKYSPTTGAASMLSSNVPEPSVWLVVATSGLIAVFKRKRTIRSLARRCDRCL